MEQKTGDIVRRHAFHYRHDTAMQLGLLDELYELVRVRFNLFTATSEATGWRVDRNGKAIRVYDAPRTPYRRVIDSDKRTELEALFEATNPAELTRRIVDSSGDCAPPAPARTRAGAR